MSTPRFNVDPLSNSFVRLIDVVFGLTLTQGFVIYRNIITTPKASIESLSLILVYATIILSWIYYHKSVLHYPYNKSHWSRVRLFFDLSILVLYAHLVFVAQDLAATLIGLIAIFSVYCLDGIVRILEWHDKKVSKPWLSVVFASIFFGEWYAYAESSFSSWGFSSWVVVLLSIGLVFGYRIVRSRLGYPIMLIVGVDVDGVLGEQVPPVLDRIKREGKSTDLVKDKIVEWDFRIDDTDISREIEKALLDPSFVTSMPLVEGSVSAMRELYKKYHVVIVTSRPIETEQETRDWLKRNFRFHEFINTRECGKNGLGLNVLVDDNLHNVRKFASSRCYALLFSQPWNLEIKDKDLEELLREKHVIRVQNWDEATTSIAKIKRALIRST